MAEKTGFSLRVLYRADQGGRARTRSSLKRPEHASQETRPRRMYTQVHSGCLHQHAPKSLYCIILRFNTASSLSREKCLSLENSPDGHPQPLVLTFHISLFTAQLSSPSRPPHPDPLSLLDFPLFTPQHGLKSVPIQPLDLPITDCKGRFECGSA